MLTLETGVFLELLSGWSAKRASRESKLGHAARWPCCNQEGVVTYVKGVFHVQDYLWYLDACVLLRMIGEEHRASPCQAVEYVGPISGGCICIVYGRVSVRERPCLS